MAINFGLLNPGAPAEIGATVGNALAMRRKRTLEDEQLAQQREEQQVQNALSRMKLQQAQTEMNEESAFKGAFGALPPGAESATPEMWKASPSRAMAFEKQIFERRKGQAEMDKSRADVAMKRLDMLGRVSSAFAQNPTRETALAGLDRLRMLDVPPEQIAGIRAQIDATPDDQLPALANQWLAQTDEAVKAQTEKMFAKPVSRTLNLGGKEIVQTVDPYTGKVISEQEYKKTMSPGEIAADARARAQLAQSERQFKERQGVERERLELERTKTATQPGTQTQKTSDAREVLQLLDQAAPLVDQATGSYLGAGIDIVGRGAGISTQGSLAGAQLRAIEGMLISKMPKMSGPQSDKDVMLYKQMAGEIGDPTIPAAQKRAAMAAIRQINERYAGTQPPSSSGGIKFLGFE